MDQILERFQVSTIYLAYWWSCTYFSGKQKLWQKKCFKGTDFDWYTRRGTREAFIREEEYLTTLKSMTNIKISGNELILSNSKGDTLVFSKWFYTGGQYEFFRYIW